MRNSVVALPPVLLLLLTLTITPARAQDANAARLVQLIAPVVDNQTLAIAHLDLGTLDAAASIDRLLDITHASPRDRAAFTPQRNAAIEKVAQLQRAGARDLFYLVNTADLPGNLYSIVIPLQPTTDALAATKVLEGLGGRVFGDADPVPAGALQIVKRSSSAGDLLLLAPPAAIERIRQGAAAARPDLAAALAAVGDSTAQLLLLPSTDTRRVIEEMLPTLPAMVGGSPTRVLTQGVTWGAIAVDLPPKKIAVRLIIQSSDAEAAVALGNQLSKILDAFSRAPAIQTMIPRIGELVKALTPKVDGSRLTLQLSDAAGDLAVLSSILTPPLDAARTAASRARSMNNFKRLMLAMFNYLDAEKKFPARAIYSAGGKPLLSWRVAILPYLESSPEGSALYKEFKLDEPWDSEHNRKLIDRMPEVLHSPFSAAEAGKTTYLAPLLVGGIFGGRETLKLREITDGTSNTVMLVEADDDHAVVWTKPDDIEINVDDPARGLYSGEIGGILTAFADGSAHFLSNELDAKALKIFFTAQGGEPVPRLP